MKLEKEKEERARAETEKKLLKKARLASSAILRMMYIDTEETLVQMTMDAYKYISDSAAVQKKIRQAIVSVQRRWRKKMTMRAAREYRMRNLTSLYRVEAAEEGVGGCTKIQATFRGNLERLRLRRGLPLLLNSDFLVGSKRAMTRGRAAIELYKECYRDFLRALVAKSKKEVYTRIGTGLFVSDLMVFREEWNHKRAEKKASVFGTDIADDRPLRDPMSDREIRPEAPIGHPEPVL